jgi:hypothetical protein
MYKFKSKPKRIWETLNELNGKKNNNKIKEVYSGNNLTSSDFEMAQSFNNHFSSVGTDILNSVDHSNVDPMSYMPNNLDIPIFSINNTGPCHVIDLVKVMQSKSSIDCNQISMKIIKFVIYEISVPLAHIFQRSIETGVFPTKFKASRIVPIFKQGDPRI